MAARDARLTSLQEIVDRQRMQIHEVRSLNTALVDEVARLGVLNPDAFGAPPASTYRAASDLPLIPRKPAAVTAPKQLCTVQSPQIVRPEYTDDLAADVLAMSDYLRDLEEARETLGQMIRHTVLFARSLSCIPGAPNMCTNFPAP